MSNGKNDARTQAVLELRRGSRAQPIPSKKKYKRKSKHRKWES